MAMLAQAIRDIQLATLVTAGVNGYRATHIPTPV
jgi:predicted FMN-binding regulatory protein PaiB